MLKINDLLDNKYRILRLIGEGGMGAVYEGKHVGTGRRVAVKVIRPGTTDDAGGVQLQRFQREARAAGAIESQYIAQVFDSGSDAAGGFPYLVLEYLTGEDVHQLQRRLGPLPVDLALRIFAQVCSGLAKAHAAKVVHRDVKPANVFLANRDDGEIICKLLDFGVAKFMTDAVENESEVPAIETAGLTQTGALVGSPLYMAPEQARGRRDIDARADIWALGILLYKLLTGKTPHERTGFGIGELIMAICMESPVPIRQVAPWVPTEIESLLSAILQLDRDARPQSVEMILAELHVLLPLGWAIDKSMLVPLPPGVAGPLTLPPASLSPGNPSLGRLLNSPPPTPANHAAQTADAPAPSPKTNPEASSPSAANSARPAMTAEASPSIPGQTKSSSGSRASSTLVLVAVAIVVIGGAAAFSRMSGQPDRPAETVVSSPPIQSLAVVPAPAISSAPAARRTECRAGMILMPGGKFVMGSDKPTLKSAQPAHRAIIDTFCIDAHEVTTSEYQACADKGECKRPPDAPHWPRPKTMPEKAHESKLKIFTEWCNFGKSDRARHPVNCIGWASANDYCRIQGKRLPTEAEWEYVARGTDDRKTPWGDSPDLIERINVAGGEFARWEKSHGLLTAGHLYETDDGFVGTAPVGSFPKGKTKHGVDDLVGNVWEWTADWFGPYEPEEEVINPKGPANGETKVIRGGAFDGGDRSWLEPAFRAEQVPDAIAPMIGFRCAGNL